MAPPDEQRRTLRRKVVIPPIARAIGSRLFKLTAVVWALQVPVMVAIVWIAEGPPTMAEDSWWNAEIFGWWYAGLLSLPLIFLLSPVVGLIFGRRRRLEEWRAARVAQITARMLEQRRSKLSLEGLRQYGNPDFDVLEVYRLHKRSEVLARCKVQAHEADYAVVLVIGGEVDRIQRSRDEHEVWSIAASWKAELLAQRWHPVEPPSRTLWRSRHDGWDVVVGPWNYDAWHGCYIAIAKPTPGPASVIGIRPHFAPTLHIAQMEILQVLAEKVGHLCSDRCTPWTFEMQMATEAAQSDSTDSCEVGHS